MVAQKRKGLKIVAQFVVNAWLDAVTASGCPPNPTDAA